MREFATSASALRDAPIGDGLTEAQFEALRWIDRNRGFKSEWTVNGRNTRKGPSAWTHLRITADAGTMLIAKGDLKFLDKLITAGPLSERRILSLSDEGRRVLRLEEERRR